MYTCATDFATLYAAPAPVAPPPRTTAAEADNTTTDASVQKLTTTPPPVSQTSPPLPYSATHNLGEYLHGPQDDHDYKQPGRYDTRA